jgi:uncharacterized protein (TIGR03083 family)
MDHAACCDRLDEEIERTAAAVADVPGDAPVPSCPDWTVSDLAFHLGRIHRWAERLVRTLADGPQVAATAFADPGPPSADWLRAGGTPLVATLRAADPAAPMWAWGADQHVAFWSRRQLHETLIHRVDTQLAGGIPPRADPEVAADGIDELLVNLPSASRFSSKVVNLRGQGERLALVPTDVAWSWTITLSPDGFSVAGGSGEADATLSGPSLDLLLVLYRRWSLPESQVSVTGTTRLAELWLANSALE